MKVSRAAIIDGVRNYTNVQLLRMQDAICLNVVSGKFGTCWHEAINAIDTELDRRSGYLPHDWALIS